MPSALTRRANSTESSMERPPSTQSVAETRTQTGRLAGKAARTARMISSGNFARLARPPPYSSVR